MLDRDCIERVGNARTPRSSDDAALRDKSRAPIFFAVRRTNEKALDAIARQFCGLRTSDQDNRLVVTLAFPPIRIFPGEMHRAFSRARERLTQLVAGHKK